MTFTDEPGIYIPGELGIARRHVAVTEIGCENLAPKWSGTPRSRRYTAAAATPAARAVQDNDQVMSR